jgi:post-segregation antitoxin (ccd killing protein)
VNPTCGEHELKNRAAPDKKAARKNQAQQRNQKWREENKKALDAYDRHIDKDGLWLHEFRTW